MHRRLVGRIEAQRGEGSSDHTALSPAIDRPHGSRPAGATAPPCMRGSPCGLLSWSNRDSLSVDKRPDIDRRAARPAPARCPIRTGHASWRCRNRSRKIRPSSTENAHHQAWACAAPFEDDGDEGGRGRREKYTYRCHQHIWHGSLIVNESQGNRRDPSVAADASKRDERPPHPVQRQPVHGLKVIGGRRGDNATKRAVNAAKAAELTSTLSVAAKLVAPCSGYFLPGAC